MLTQPKLVVVRVSITGTLKCLSGILCGVVLFSWLPCVAWAVPTPCRLLWSNTICFASLHTSHHLVCFSLSSSRGGRPPRSDFRACCFSWEQAVTLAAAVEEVEKRLSKDVEEAKAKAEQVKVC